MNSPNSSENEFLTKLTELIETNLTNPQFGVSMLARELGMSRSNLHRKVISSAKITVSQFIGHVRLQHAMEMLRHTSFTVSDVAHKVGFSNTSYFIKCFHNYYGYPPGEVGKRDSDENHANSAFLTKKKRLSTLLVSVAFIIVLALALFLVLKPLSGKQNKIDKTIAVLPFMDDSPEKGNEHIVNGLRRDILGKLEKIKNLRVIPGSSTEKFRDSKLDINEIASELHADYILCGSGQKIGSSIKIDLELIEISTGYNLWTKPYIKEANEDGIFDLQEEVALAVADELQVYITPEEKSRIRKKPTENKIAWDYYLRGMEKKRDSMEVAITFFEKAIEYDSKFALAYAELALSYFRLDVFLADKIHLTLINDYADKALFYDSELDMSWFAKAMYYRLRGEYVLVIQYLEKTLQFNPNSGLAVGQLARIYAHIIPNSEQHLKYALLAFRLYTTDIDTLDKCNKYRISQAFRYAGFFNEAEKYIDWSLGYDPECYITLVEKSQLLADMTGKYEESKEILLEMFDKDSSDVDLIRHLGLTCYMMRDYDESFKYYKKLIEIENAQNLVLYPGDYGRIGFVYKNMGEDKKAEEFFNRHMKFLETLNSVHKYRLLASVFSYRGDTVNALAQMRIFSQQDDYPYWVIRVFKQEPLYDNIRELPEFKKILSEIEIKFWENHERIKTSLEEKGLL